MKFQHNMFHTIGTVFQKLEILNLRQNPIVGNAHQRLKIARALFSRFYFVRLQELKQCALIQ